jgi:hypothetical protein
VQVDVGDVSVMVDRAQTALGTRLGEESEGTHTWLGLGRVTSGPLRLMLAKDQPTFARWTHGAVPPWSAGAAWPDRGVIVLRLDLGDPFETLHHELAHIALHHQISGRVPRWFDEGYAVVAAGELGRLSGLRLDLAVATGDVPSLRELDGALVGEGVGAEEAYALAGSAVLAIAQLHPSGRLDPFLAAMQSGSTFEGAMAAQGLTPDQFETEWHRLLKRQYNLGIWFLTGGAWVVLAVVLSIGVLWRRHLDAPRRAALNVGWALPEDDIEMTTPAQLPETLDPAGKNH